MYLPAFTAEASLRSATSCKQRAASSHKSVHGEVIPQAYQVVCSINADNELHCGIHDFSRGISIPLF